MLHWLVLIYSWPYDTGLSSSNDQALLMVAVGGSDPYAPIAAGMV